MLSASIVSSQFDVCYEHLDRTKEPWSFVSIPKPSRSDAALKARIWVEGLGFEEPNNDGSALVNGVLPANPDDLAQLCFLSNNGSEPATVTMDLLKLVDVTEVCTYSWHEFGSDQGSRAPQVYTLSASADGKQWTDIAKVDTRPNKAGEGWGGQYGVSVKGKFGKVRYLRFVIEPTMSPLQPNRNWTNTLFAEIDVHTKATRKHAGDASVERPANVTDVWVVIKSHFDLGFTDLAENVFERYRGEMMDNALAVIDENRKLPKDLQFVWTVPGWPMMQQMLGPQQDSIRKERIERAVKEGSIAVHALPFTTHTESLEPEDIIAGIRYSSMVSRKYGLPLPIAAKMTDVPSHSWILPTILSQSGVKFLHLGDNPASQYPRVPQLFWWQGPDGSKVLCMYSNSYGTGLVPPANWPCRNYLAMVMLGDNQGPPSIEQVDQWRKECAQAMPGVRVHFSTLDAFARAVLDEKPELPTVNADMPDTWIHGLLSMPQETKLMRNERPFIGAAASLGTLMSSWGVQTSSAQEKLDKAQELSLLFGEHTWGMNAEYGPRKLYGAEFEKWMKEMEAEPLPQDGDYSKVPRGSKRKWLQSYEDHRNYARTSASIIEELLSADLKVLASKVKGAGPRAVVFNALPWKRSGYVEVDGQTVYAKDVPPMGYKVVPMVQDQLKPVDTPKESKLDTGRYAVRFDLKRGGLASVIEKSTGKELVNQHNDYAFGQYLHEKFSINEVNRFFKKYARLQVDWGLNDIGKPGMPEAKDRPYEAITPGGWELAILQSGAKTVATLSATKAKGLAQAVSISFTFYANDPAIDIKWSVKGKTPDKGPEGGWLCLPFNEPKPKFTVGRLGAPIDPKAIVPGTNRHLLATTTGVSVGNAAFCSLDSPLVSLQKPGIWWWTMDFEPAKANAFVNLYNNMWNTNFPLWQEGSWTSRVRVWPDSSGMVVKSWESRVPLRGVKAEGQGGSLPGSQPGISVSRKGVLVTWFGQNPDGEGTLLRLWDQSGKSGSVEVKLPSGALYHEAQPVNLRGEPTGEPITIKNGLIKFDLGRYSFVSLVLR